MRLVFCVAAMDTREHVAASIPRLRGSPSRGETACSDTVAAFRKGERISSEVDDHANSRFRPCHEAECQRRSQDPVRACIRQTVEQQQDSENRGRCAAEARQRRLFGFPHRQCHSDPPQSSCDTACPDHSASATARRIRRHEPRRERPAARRSARESFSALSAQDEHETNSHS